MENSQRGARRLLLDLLQDDVGQGGAGLAGDGMGPGQVACE